MSKYNRTNQNEFNEYKFINRIVKEQNKKLLYEIAKFKEMNEEETEEFVNEYLKPNYYMLEITHSYKKEERQRNFIF
tara:strand:+ start:500 stop:730 length:231 start_codon:yes stop_codon:yes gene_type:complete